MLIDVQLAGRITGCEGDHTCVQIGAALRELASLSDRDLADLGISRAVIAQVASEAAYGK